jgi:hypothetical protein
MEAACPFKRVEQAQQNSTWCETTKDNCHLNICLEKLKLYYSKKYEFKVSDSVCGNKLDVNDMECSYIFLSSSYFRHV